MAKTMCRIKHAKKNRNRKKWGQRWKTLYQLMNNAAYGKTMKILRNRIDVRLVSKKRLLFRIDIKNNLFKRINK